MPPKTSKATTPPLHQLPGKSLLSAVLSSNSANNKAASLLLPYSAGADTIMPNCNLFEKKKRNDEPSRLPQRNPRNLRITTTFIQQEKGKRSTRLLQKQSLANMQ
jgi:hypothetical protein